MYNFRILATCLKWCLQKFSFILWLPGTLLIVSFDLQKHLFLFSTISWQLGINPVIRFLLQKFLLTLIPWRGFLYDFLWKYKCFRFPINTIIEEISLEISQKIASITTIWLHHIIAICPQIGKLIIKIMFIWIISSTKESAITKFAVKTTLNEVRQS